MVNVLHISSQHALNSNRNPSFGFDWSANPYRGCSHACQYCYARETHRYLNLDIGQDFRKTLFVKDNFADVLRKELKHVPLNNIIALGTATDPYQPLESKYRITRSILEVLVKTGHALTITTKSPLILRDLDLLSLMGQRRQLQIHVSLISLDPETVKILEPGAPNPKRRINTMAELLSHDIPTAWFLAPILPFITDDDKTLESIFAMGHSLNVRWLMASVAHFTPSMYQYFYNTAAHTPLRTRIRQFAEVYHMPGYKIDGGYRRNLRRRLTQLYLRYGIASSIEPPRGFESFHQNEFSFGNNHRPLATPL